MISLQDFEDYCDRLEKHDWFYEFSDDGSVYRAGREKHTQLIQQSFQQPMLGKAFDLYHDRSKGMTRQEIRQQIAELKAEFLITA